MFIRTLRSAIVASAILVATLPRTSAAQGADSSTVRVVTVEHRSVGAATALSLIFPGAGQMYAGRPRLGAGLMASYFAAMAYSTSTWQHERERAWKEHRTPKADAAVSTAYLVGMGTWAYALITAPRDVNAYNARQMEAAKSRRVEPVVARSHSGARVGVRLWLGR